MHRIWTVAAGALCLWASGCELICPAGEENIGGSCAPITVIDTDEDTDVETDTEEVVFVNDENLVRIEWETVVDPNDNRIELECDGIVLYSGTGFSGGNAFEYETDLDVGAQCIVRRGDDRGGLIGAGKVFNCSIEVASWDEERANVEEIASFEVVECVRGCPDPIALNFTEGANLDDGSCDYIDGCTDPRALNYNPAATRDNGSCDYGGFGIVEVTVRTGAIPTDIRAAVDCNGQRVWEKANYTNNYAEITKDFTLDAGFDCQMIIGNDNGGFRAPGSIRVCGQEIGSWDQSFDVQPSAYEETMVEFFMTPCSGCTVEEAPNYDPDALVDDGSCVVLTP